MASAAEIVRFWRDAGPKFWFVKDETFDGRCRTFEAEHHAAARGELGAWDRRSSPAVRWRWGAGGEHVERREAKAAWPRT